MSSVPPIFDVHTSRLSVPKETKRARTFGVSASSDTPPIFNAHTSHMTKIEAQRPQTPTGAQAITPKS
jgi:hypothetical protein